MTLTDAVWPTLKIRHPWPDARYTVTHEQCNLREEPDALTRTSGSVRGPRGNPGSYRCARHGQQLGGESPLSSQMTAKD